MKKIFFIGNGGHFKEQYYLVLDCLKNKNLDFELSGIITNNTDDSKIDKITNLRIYHEKEIHYNNDIYIYISIGDPIVREKIINKYKNFNFFTMIHPSSYVSPGSKIGKGCTISPNVVVAGNAVIRDFNNLNFNSNISHDCLIDVNNTFSPGSKIMGNCEVGSNNFFGASCVVIPKVKIGNKNIIAANSTITKNIKNNCLMAGSPAIVKKNINLKDNF